MASTEEFVSAVKSGDLARVRELLASEPDLAKANADGVSALMLATYYGHPDVALVIVDGRDGDISVHEASTLGDQGAVKRLVEGDSSLIHQFSGDGFTPLQLACYFGHKEVAAVLLELGSDPNVVSQNHMKVAPLHSALAGGHIEIARLLLANGADASMVAGEGWTPLHYAADIGDAEIAQELIAKGARGGVANEKGLTAEQLGHEVGHGHVSDVIEAADR